MRRIRLTSRERDILRLIARGYSNNRIGEALGISPRTARNGVSAILVKLRARNRAEAAVIGIERGIVPLRKRGGGSRNRGQKK